MKKIYIPLVCLLISGIGFSQPLKTGTGSSGKIKLANGQKITVESSVDIQASLTMGMELTSNSSSINALEVKNSTAKDITISNTLTKMKVNMNMMGQPNNYDSEHKEGNNEEMAKIFDERLNKPVDVVVDNTTGLSVTETKKEKKADADAANPADDLMKMFSDNSDNGIVAGAFEIIPVGKSAGDSWSDTALAKDMKMIRTYTLKSITGNEALIQVDVVSNAVNKLDFQEMEFEVKTETKTKGEILADTITSLVKKRTTTSDISGTIQMMGQDMPISAKTTSTNIYK
ncbi:MAG: DUF6263 family protein [Ferruginibacter sp.]